MELDIRAVGSEEMEAFARAISSGFGGEHRPEEVAHLEAVLEPDRTVAAYDGSEIVGTGGALSHRLTVPGGEVSAAGVTVVSVLPTHRRRGILSRMMRHQLDDVRERGEPVASLWASESVIYGRFGYGMAAEGIQLDIERARAVFRDPVDRRGSVRLVSKEEALADWPGVYEAFRPGRPGAVGRTQSWWEHHTLHDPEHRRHGYSSNRHAVYEEDGEPLGYVVYRIKHQWPEGLPSSELAVEELVANGPSAYVALWDFVFGVDLVSDITAHNRPLDEPLLWMLADPRRLKRRPSDSLWVRLVDVPAALASRRYSVEGGVVLEVRDPFCPWNEGVYALEGGPDGAGCRPTGDRPDLVVSVADLAASYLGRSVLTALVRAGRVEGDLEAARQADLMFSWDPAPWNVEVF